MGWAVPRRVRPALLTSAVIAFVVTALGCATTRRRGDDAWKRGAYVEAANLYDQALAEDPKDEEARAGRSRAREAALAAELEQARVLRAQNQQDAARLRLARFFTMRRHWKLQTPTALIAPVEREARAASAEVERRLHPLLAADAALSAEGVLAEERAIADEPETLAARARMDAAVAAVGARRCAAMNATVKSESPYWGWLVARYCEHFGVAGAVPVLPFSVAGIEITGAVDGASGPAGQAVVAGLRRAVHGTPWYSPAAAAQASARLAARYGVNQQHVPVTLTAAWTESVPYTTTVSRRVPYQVPYQASETYFDQVPYTTLESESYPCGFGRNHRTCTRSRTVTRYRSQMRTRWVTRHRTEYRTVYDTVTRYRIEPRVFSYPGVRHDNTYALNGTLAIALPEGAPVQVALDGSELLSGVSHDATFLAAGVAPTRPELPSADGWLLANVDRLVARVSRDLREAWSDRFCRDAGAGLEPAARCLYGRQPAAAATGVLRAELGPEADALAAFALRAAP
jgi:hypothetical protein